jgi:HAE1 family hydrophobic/amphiphilic exporter-1/multidrug efflux pump
LRPVFVPVAFLGGLTGQLYKQFALTLAVSVVLSAICALTFTPRCARCCWYRWRKLIPGMDRSAGFSPSSTDSSSASRNGYVKSVATMERHAVIVMLTFAALLLAVWGLISNRPTGFVPPEDQGYLLCLVSLPTAASLERTNAAMSAVTRIARDTPGHRWRRLHQRIQSADRPVGSYNGTAFLRLKPWDERKKPPEQVAGLVNTLNGKLNAQIKDAQVLVLNPPPIRGLSTAGGFTFVLQNRVGADPAELFRVLQGLLAEARKRPEIGFVYSGFDTRIPQIEFQVDRDKVKSLGIQLSDVFFALQTFLGSFYVNDFNLFGRTTASRRRRRARSAASRTTSIASTCAPTADDGAASDAGEQSGRSTVRSISSVTTSTASATINGTNRSGYSSGRRSRRWKSSPRAASGFAYEWSEATYQEKKTGGQTGYIFGCRCCS